MARLKIKSDNSREPSRKSVLLEILSNADIYITKLIPVNDGFIIITIDEDQDKVFQEGVKTKLTENNFHTVLPPELKARRSVIIFKVDPHIYNNSESDITRELQTHNEWIQDGIDTVFKFPNSKTIKITFTQAIYASKAQEHGLKLLQMKIPKHQINQEKYYNIKTCFRCYKLDDHYTNSCPMPAQHKICSECSVVGHTWNECTSTTKKCINCNEDHRTLSMKCPKRKDVIKKLREEEQEKGKNSYAQTTKTIKDPDIAGVGKIQIDKISHMKIYSSMIHAHMMNVIEPGCFESELKATFEINNLPAIKIPRAPNSVKLLATMTELEKKTDVMDTAEAQASKQAESSPTHEESSPKPVQQISKKLHSRDIQLEIITRESNGWPENINLSQLTLGIENETYKYTYNEDMLNPEDVKDLLRKGEIILENCWRTVEDSIFRKIRSGHNNERTPPSIDTRRKRLGKNLSQ